jgi:hypothetical protein
MWGVEREGGVTEYDMRLEGNQRNKIEAEAQIAQVEGKEEVGSAATGRPRADSTVC